MNTEEGEIYKRVTIAPADEPLVQRIANLESALQQVRQAFIDNDASGGDHPWISGVDAKRVIGIIEGALK